MAYNEQYVSHQNLAEHAFSICFQLHNIPKSNPPVMSAIAWCVLCCGARICCDINFIQPLRTKTQRSCNTLSNSKLYKCNEEPAACCLPPAHTQMQFLAAHKSLQQVAAHHLLQPWHKRRHLQEQRRLFHRCSCGLRCTDRSDSYTIRTYFYRPSLLYSLQPQQPSIFSIICPFLRLLLCLERSFLPLCLCLIIPASSLVSRRRILT